MNEQMNFGVLVTGYWVTLHFLVPLFIYLFLVISYFLMSWLWSWRYPFWE